MANKPVFFDASGRRAVRFAYIGWGLAILATVIAIGFVTNLLITPPERNATPPERARALRVEARAEKPGLVASAERLAAAARRRRMDYARRHPQGASERMLSSILKPQPGRPLAVGIYVNWPGSVAPSTNSLKRNLPHLDWVIPTWFEMQGPSLTFKPNLDRPVLDYMRGVKPGVAILPILQNASGGKWYGSETAKLLADTDRRGALIAQLASFVAANKLQGVVVDFETLPPSSYGNFKLFLSELSANFSGPGWIVAVTAPFDDDNWPFASFAGVVDYTLLMALDEHYQSGEAGPIASQDWYEFNLDKRMAVLDPAATIVLFANYGFDWIKGDTEATQLQFSEVMAYARDAGATVAFDQASNNPHFRYEDTDGVHDVWFLDAVTAFNQIHAADPYQPAGYGFWRLGMEDPSISALLQRPYNLPAPQGLRRIAPDEFPYSPGSGEILWVESDPTMGTRDLTYDVQTGDIVDETYTALPTNYVVRQMGASTTKLAITFDDGPDPQWTPQLLDILKAKHVPATFFMIGANMEAHPGLVQRVLAEGHEIGNHTYTHPNLADTPLGAVRLELNATQRLFEALTGRSMRLFRPPYLADTEPGDAAEIEPIELAQQLGYTTVSTNVETLDWRGFTPEQMMKRTLDLVYNSNPDLKGDIILMHDSGGDRSNTVKFLPLLIDTMRARGYKFVPVSDLICGPVMRGVETCRTRDEVMPALPVTISLYADRLVFLTLSAIGQGLYYCFLGAIVLGVARLLLLCGLAFWQTLLRREAPPAAAGAPALVSVLIPAFNEEKVIVSTVEEILASDYPNLEVLVIDDGSKDHTAYIVKSHFMREPRVGVISVPNGGKANALNVGLSNCHGEVVVALDADTYFNRDTIRRLVRWFADPEVGAMAGNAKVGNRVNMITRWQALEYIVAQNLERRALSAIGVLTVVPGAVGAWRRRILAELGGFPTDTLAEDQDLTIAIQTRGYRVGFDSAAIAWTEAPVTVKGLAKQRFRWAYGTLQCLWKYRHITFNPRQGELGMVALPQVWLFQILLTALAPVADLLLIWQLISQYLAYIQHPDDFSFANLEVVLGYYAVFVLVDLLAGTIGFLMEKGEDWKLLLWLPLQRFGYRQIMYYVVLRSISTALKGPFVGWGKLERTGMAPRRA